MIVGKRTWKLDQATKCQNRNSFFFIYPGNDTSFVSFLTVIGISDQIYWYKKDAEISYISYLDFYQSSLVYCSDRVLLTFKQTVKKYLVNVSFKFSFHCQESSESLRGPLLMLKFFDNLTFWNILFFKMMPNFLRSVWKTEKIKQSKTLLSVASWPLSSKLQHWGHAND